MPKPIVAAALVFSIFGINLPAESAPDTSKRMVPSAVCTRNGLPPTLTDSFVKEAGSMAEYIYGDEGPEGLPPYEEFTPIHRINVGIMGIRDQVLTTGHGSNLPSSWGGDEFVDTEPFNLSGRNNGAYPLWAQTQGVPSNSQYDLSSFYGGSRELGNSPLLPHWFPGSTPNSPSSPNAQ